jgi:hypothetical protein
MPHKTLEATASARRGETPSHATLKALAIAWAREQGMSLAAPEVSFPHRRFRVDVAACCPVRKVPSRKPLVSITSILRSAAVFECKQVRSDLIRDNKRRTATTARLKTLEDRRLQLETLLQVHLPHLANGESLLPEFDSYRLRDCRHAGYRKLTREIAVAKRGIMTGTKFDRLFPYGLANLHYLVVENKLIEPHELPIGWGLLIRMGDTLQLAAKPVWQDISIEDQLVFIQRIAAIKASIS